MRHMARNRTYVATSLARASSAIMPAGPSPRFVQSLVPVLLLWLIELGSERLGTATATACSLPPAGVGREHFTRVLAGAVEAQAPRGDCDLLN